MIENYLKEKRALVEEALKTAVPKDAPPRLVEACNYSLLAGGKRLRPILTLAACEAAGGKLIMSSQLHRAPASIRTRTARFAI